MTATEGSAMTAGALIYNSICLWSLIVAKKIITFHFVLYVLPILHMRTRVRELLLTCIKINPAYRSYRGRIQILPIPAVGIGKISEMTTSDTNITTRDPEVEIIRLLSEPLREVSRQRLRAVLMGLRRCANIEMRVTTKDLAQVCLGGQWSRGGVVVLGY